MFPDRKSADVMRACCQRSRQEHTFMYYRLQTRQIDVVRIDDNTYQGAFLHILSLCFPLQGAAAARPAACQWTDSIMVQ